MTNAEIFIIKWNGETDKSKLFFELTSTLNQLEHSHGIKEITTPQDVIRNHRSKYHLLRSLASL